MSVWFLNFEGSRRGELLRPSEGGGNRVVESAFEGVVLRGVRLMGETESSRSRGVSMRAAISSLTRYNSVVGGITMSRRERQAGILCISSRKMTSSLSIAGNLSPGSSRSAAAAAGATGGVSPCQCSGMERLLDVVVVQVLGSGLVQR